MPYRVRTNMKTGHRPRVVTTQTHSRPLFRRGSNFSQNSEVPHRRAPPAERVAWKVRERRPARALRAYLPGWTREHGIPPPPVQGRERPSGTAPVFGVAGGARFAPG